MAGVARTILGLLAESLASKLGGSSKCGAQLRSSRVNKGGCGYTTRLQENTVQAPRASPTETDVPLS